MVVVVFSQMQNSDWQENAKKRTEIEHTRFNGIAFNRVYDKLEIEYCLLNTQYSIHFKVAQVMLKYFVI